MGTPALLDLIAPPAPGEVPTRSEPSGRPRLVVLEGGRGRSGPVSSPLCRPARHPATITRRDRLVVLVAVTTLAFLAVNWFDGGSEVPTQAVGAPVSVGERSVYVVQPGDTLWSVARRLGPDGDVRSTVDALIARHGSASIAVGDRLSLAGLTDDP